MEEAIKVKVAGSVKEDGGFVVYHLVVQCGGLEWRLKRRFREFVHLDKQLKKVLEINAIKDHASHTAAFEHVEEQKVEDRGTKQLAVDYREHFPKLPKKEFMKRHSTKAKVIEKRRVELEAYLSRLVRLAPFQQNPPSQLLQFLGMLSQPFPVSSPPVPPDAKKNENEKEIEKDIDRVHLFKLVQVAKPGDIILFKSTNVVASLQRRITQSKWDHVAIVVKKKGSETLELLEATGDGVQTYPLVSRLFAYSEGYASVMAMRRLLVERNERMERGLQKLVEHVQGMPYEISLAKLMYTKQAKPMYDKPSTTNSPNLPSQTTSESSTTESYSKETLQEYAENVSIEEEQDIKCRTKRLDSATLIAETRQENFFCSELVAEAFCVMGLLPRVKRANYYWPVSFDEGGQVDRSIAAHSGVHCPLSKPIYIDFNVLPLQYSYKSTD